MRDLGYTYINLDGKRDYVDGRVSVLRVRTYFIIGHIVVLTQLTLIKYLIILVLVHVITTSMISIWPKSCDL